MNLTQYASEMGISKPAALEHVNRLSWVSKDGRSWTSQKIKVKNKTVWDIQEETGRSDETQEIKSLKDKKTVEEIKLLQNRNAKMRADLMRDWTNCMYRGFTGFFGAVSGKINGLRIDKELADKLNDILKTETDSLQERIDQELHEYEEANKVRLR